MITIKIIQHYVEVNPEERVDGKVPSDRETGNPITHIYEADDLLYQFIYFQNSNEFLEKYDSETKGNINGNTWILLRLRG